MYDLRLDGLTLANRYEIRGRISTGSYAEVFIARDLEGDSKDVVIKALNELLQGTIEPELSEMLAENFEKEAQILESISHPNIIAILGRGESKDIEGRSFPFLALEYMLGGDLLRFTRSQPNGCLDFGQTLEYLRQICDALSHAHENGIIHRDLKPNNFLLDAGHSLVKIADFGVAKLDSADSSEITRVGTDAFSAPEHSPSAAKATIGRLTASADIYSLAKSCFAFVCGRTPNEFAGSPIKNFPPAVKNYPWSDPLLKILGRATKSEISARYASVSDFWKDLAELAVLDPDATIQATKKRLSPEEQELVNKKAELYPLEGILAQRELDLVSFLFEMKEFELLYLQIVGVKYAELDRLEAQIAELKAKQRPNDREAQKRAAEARARASESTHSTESLAEGNLTKKFKPSDTLKKLYRELARIIHPDLVLDENEKARRHKLMARANRAHAEGDEKFLVAMLDEWQNSPEAVKGEGVAAELIRIIRRISQAKIRLATIEDEFADLKETDLFQLKAEADEADLNGRDILAEMAEQVNGRIQEAQHRFNDHTNGNIKNEH